MGKSQEGIAASSGNSEKGQGSCKAHDVSLRPPEDCGVSAGKVGEVEVRTSQKVNGFGSRFPRFHSQISCFYAENRVDTNQNNYLICPTSTAERIGEISLVNPK
jgi:hypothetical protein